ncbi:MAG: hypothetical protein ACREN3_11840 [Gemmatimonadaceae bacterium]
MTRSFVLLLACSSLLSAQQATVVHNVNLRPTPSSAQPPRELLRPQEEVTLIEPAPTSGYYDVRAPDQQEGWVWGRDITIATAPTATVNPAGPPLPAAGSYASDNASCPPVGEHSVHGTLAEYSATSDAGLRNMAKRHVPVGTTPVTLTVAGFIALQDAVDTKYTDAHHTKTSFHPTRDGLKDLPLNGTTVSEGQLVQIAAYLNAVRPQGNESVNCAGQDGDDIHLNVGARNGTEWQGVVVEMIPQLQRPAGWDAATLEQVAQAKLEVLVVGGLTYDNEHLVNDDSTHPNGTQPKRASLWEIHPITGFYVCAAGTCDPATLAEWTTLSAWAAAH